MNIKALLDTDLAVIGQTMARGLDWWRDELTGLLPGWARPAAARLPARIAVAAGGHWRSYRRKGGRYVPMEGTNGTATIVLQPTSALIFEIDLPALPRRDQRRLLAAELDALTPFSAAEAVFDFIDRGSRGRGAHDIAVIPHARIAEAMADAAGAGIAPDGIAIAGADGVTPRFHPGNDSAAAGGWARRLWLAVGVLMAVNIGLLVWRDIAALDTLRGVVAEQEQTVTRIERLHRTVEAEAARRRLLLDRIGAAAPLSIIARLTDALPDSAYLDRLSFDGSRLSIAGEGDAETVAALLAEAPPLDGARITGLTGQTGADGRPTFEITLSTGAAP